MNKIFPKPTQHPLLASLPVYLKDPANFHDIQKKILATILTSCTHSEMSEFAACKICTEKMLERRRLLKKLGFKNPAQYMAWRRVHEQIQRRLPLVDWKANKPIL